MKHPPSLYARTPRSIPSTALTPFFPPSTEHTVPTPPRPSSLPPRPLHIKKEIEGIEWGVSLEWRDLLHQLESPSRGVGGLDWRGSPLELARVLLGTAEPPPCRVEGEGGLQEGGYLPDRVGHRPRYWMPVQCSALHRLRSQPRETCRETPPYSELTARRVSPLRSSKCSGTSVAAHRQVSPVASGVPS